MTDQTQNKFIYFPVYLSDYVSQSRKLTMLQRGALIDLSVLYFQENLKISYTKEHIYRMIFAFTSEEQVAIDFILENFFIKSENKPTGLCWVSNELNNIANKVLKRLNASRENGKKGGRGNIKKNKPIAKPIGYDLVNLDKSILNEIKLNEIKLNKTNKFIKPTIQEIKNYCLTRNNQIDYEQFFNYYEANGWKVGKNTMKDWQACIRTWERNRHNNKNYKQTGRVAELRDTFQQFYEQDDNG